MASCHHEVLEPAARSISNRKNVCIDRSQSNDPLALNREQNVCVAVMYCVLEPGPPALGGVPRCAHARRLEQFFDQRQRRRFIVRRRQAYGDR